MNKLIALVVPALLCGCALSPEYRAEVDARYEAARHSTPLTPRLRAAIAISVKNFMDKRGVLLLKTAKVVNTTISPEATIDLMNTFKKPTNTPVYCVSVDIEGHTIFENHRKYAVFVDGLGDKQIILSAFTKISGYETGPCFDTLAYAPFPELLALFRP